MKKRIFTTLIMMVMTVVCLAQSKNLEPEYIGQVVVVNADSTTMLLKKEAVTMKTKTSKWGMIPIPGSSLLDKAKTLLTLKGKAAPVTLPKGTVTLIVRAESHDKEPRKVFGVMKLDVGKKNRTFLMGESSFVSGTDMTMNYSNVAFVAKKYGESSYMVVIEDMEPGEYAVNMDFSQMATFSVK